MIPVLITDIDGTLVDHTYDLTYVNPKLQEALSKGALLIFATTKTLDEVLLYIEQWSLPRNNIYIVAEAGGLVAGEKILKYDYEVNGLEVLELGDRLEDNDLSPVKDSGCEVKGYRDMRLDELMIISGLSKDFAIAARKRFFTESLYSKDKKCLRKLETIYSGMGYFTHLGRRFLTIGKIPGKAYAVKILLNLIPALRVEEMYTYGFGDADMDVEMVELTDEAFVIPSYKKIRLMRSYYTVAPIPAPEGWIYVYDRYVKLSSPMMSRGIHLPKVAPNQ